MGIFGGGNKTESRTDIQNTDNRVAASDQAIVAAAGANIEFQDPGIVSVLDDLQKKRLERHWSGTDRPGNGQCSKSTDGQRRS